MKKTAYDIIKKQNGESFAQAIRNYDSGIFDVLNLPHIVKYAGRDAAPLLKWLESLKKIKIKRMKNHADPIELLSRAGYDAYIADTFEKQNAIEKYFAPGERLCTFDEPNRYCNYYIINAVRRGVDNIVRSPHPEREDEYGTSVISIQVLKIGGFISIKNRYNHTVDCPDNTFNSNPDNIINGLSDAISSYFGVDFSTAAVPVPKNFVIIGDQICKYNVEQRGIYYGKDFYIERGRIQELNKNIEWMIHPGLKFNVSTKTVDVAPQTDIGWLANLLRDSIKDKPVQMPKNTLGGYDILAGGQKVLSFKDGRLNWVTQCKPGFVENGISHAHFVGDVVDFSGFYDLYLERCDFSEVRTLVLNTQGRRIYMNHVTGLHGVVDCTGVKNLVINDTDLSRVVLRLNPDAHSIDLSYVSGMSGCHDLSHVERFDASGADFTGVQLKLNPVGMVMGLHPAHPAYKEFLNMRKALGGQLFAGQGRGL